MGEAQVDDLTSYTETYLRAAQDHWWFRARARVVAAVARARVQVAEGALVLDVGSGPGGLARRLFPRQRLVALDRDVSMLQAYLQADDRVIGDGRRLPCRMASVEVLCAFDVLEHLDGDQQVLEEWRRVLAPKGWLVLTVPAYRALWSAHDDANGHLRRYRASELRALLERAGYVVARLTYFNTLLLPAVAAVRWVQRLRPGKHLSRSAGHARLDFDLALPGWVSWCCERFFSAEAWWLRQGRLPAGVSICALARPAHCRGDKGHAS